jgi:hypothetical protein
MSKMGRYCKAYPTTMLNEFGGWAENYHEPSKEEQGVSADESNGDGPASSENDYLFLQENFTVTKGIFLDEDVVFDKVTPEWKDFCKNTLNFEVPSDVSAASNEEALGSNNGQR